MPHSWVCGPFNTHSFAFSPAKFCCIYYPLSLSLFCKIILYWSFSAMGLGGEEVERKITCMRNYIHCLYPELFNFFVLFLFLWNYTTFYYLHTGNLLGFLCASSAKWEKWWHLLYTLLWRLSKIPYLIVFKKRILSRFLYLWSQNVNTGPSVL